MARGAAHSRQQPRRPPSIPHRFIGRRWQLNWNYRLVKTRKIQRGGRVVTELLLFFFLILSCLFSVVAESNWQWKNKQKEYQREKENERRMKRESGYTRKMPGGWIQSTVAETSNFFPQFIPFLSSFLWLHFKWFLSFQLLLIFNWFGAKWQRKW